MSVSEVASKLSSSGVPIHDFCCNFCSACAVTVVFFGHLDRSLYLLTLLCLTVMLHASVLCCVAGVFACSLRATVLWWSIVLMVSCMRCSGTVKTFHQHCSLAGLNRLQPEWVTYILTRSYIATSSHPSQSTYLCLSVCLPLCLSVCLCVCICYGLRQGSKPPDLLKTHTCRFLLHFVVIWVFLLGNLGLLWVFGRELLDAVILSGKLINMIDVNFFKEHWCTYCTNSDWHRGQWWALFKLFPSVAGILLIAQVPKACGRYSCNRWK